RLGAAQQSAVHARTRAILGALPAESLLMSVCRRRRPEAVVARMVEDVDLSLHPAWASEGLATLDELEGHEMAERLTFLACILPQEVGTGRIRAIRRAAIASVTQAF